MTFQASASLAEQIAEHLAQQIICGELKAGERIQEMRLTQRLNVSRGSVREALLVLQRRHLIEILPRRGAQVAALDPHKVCSLYDLMIELYIQLANAVADRWAQAADLAPIKAIPAQLREACEQEDLDRFVALSFATMRQGYAFANNPYLQETIENLQPAIARTYHLALDQRRSSLAELLQALVALLSAIEARDKPRIRSLIENYCRHNCQLVLAALNA